MKYKKEKQEKDFGLVFSIIFGIASIYFYFRSNNSVIFFIFFFFLLFFLLSTLFKPRLLRIPTILWLDLSIIISKITNPIIISLIFFLFLTPVGLILKTLRIDLLKKNINIKLKSYWEKKIDYKTNPKNQF